MLLELIFIFLLAILVSICRDWRKDSLFLGNMSESLRWRSLQDDLAQVTITADNQGPLLAIATWFLMVTMILAVIFRVAIRLINTSAPGIEDTTISLALVMNDIPLLELARS
jgi:hypothetical protein